MMCEKIVLQSNKIEMSCDQTDENRLIEGTTCTFSCPEGHSLVGSDSTTCIDEIWSSPVPKVKQLFFLDFYTFSV